MSLSCDCGFDDDFDYYYSVQDPRPLDTKRRQRCRSCRELIDIGATVWPLER